MRFKSGLIIGVFGLVVVILGDFYFAIGIAGLTYFALLELFRMAEFLLILFVPILQVYH